MLIHVNRRFAVHLIIFVFVTILLILTLLRWIFSDQDLWLLTVKSAFPAITLTIGAVNWNKCYTFLVKQNNRLQFLSPLLDLNGVWRVEIQSNWPRIQQSSAETEEHTPLKKVTGTLTLTCNFFQTRGYFQVSDTGSDRRSRTRRSDIVASSLRKENGHYLFSYIAKANVSDPDPGTDEQNYLFSTEVCFQDDDVDHGIGQYWTNRKYSTGHNAAGEISLLRLAGQ